MYVIESEESVNIDTDLYQIEGKTTQKDNTIQPLQNKVPITAHSYILNHVAVDCYERIT